MKMGFFVLEAVSIIQLDKYEKWVVSKTRFSIDINDIDDIVSISIYLIQYYKTYI